VSSARPRLPTLEVGKRRDRTKNLFGSFDRTRDDAGPSGPTLSAWAGSAAMAGQIHLPTNDGCAQFTNRRMLTLIANPRPRKVNIAEEPPWLISGNGMPVIGKKPIIMPMLTAT
jgi:hypothetical protein